ncbi:MAG: PKD domain-containing protein [Crocinitomicaceae bacterium]
MKILFYFLTLICFIPHWLWSQDAHVNHVGGHSHESTSHQSLIENKGQWPDGVLFQSPIDGGKVWVQQNKFVYHLQDFSAMHESHANPSWEPTESIQNKQEVIHLNFLGSQKVNQIKKSDPSKHYFNYLKGNDPDKWANKVQAYSHASLVQFYDGIDLQIENKGNQFKYEFIVAPQISTDKIQFEYVGQKALKILNNGDIEITTQLGMIYEEHPYAFQYIEGKKIEVPCAFKITEGIVSFEIGSYNHDFELVIDPVLIFATYNGANADNFGMTATYGYDETAYSGGMVYGNGYPTPDNGAFDVNSNFTVELGVVGISDVFVSKYSEDGLDMLWSTFLGGGNNNQGTETAHSMICDENNNLYLFGSTSSADFPVSAGAYNSTHNGGALGFNFGSTGVNHSEFGIDLYVSKLSEDGTNLLGSSYVGGSGNDGVNYDAANYTAFADLTSNYGDNFRGEIMLDASNNVIVASCTHSNDFPVVNAFQNANAGAQDGVVFKLSADFTQLLSSSYYGGAQNDACYSVKVDHNGNIVFAGGTESNVLPGTTGGFQANYSGGTDGFVVKTNASGSNITQASYVGMNQYDQVFFVEVDRVDNIFLLGQSVGGTFPVNNAPYSNGVSSNFIMKLNSNLTTNLASTRFGNGSPQIHISPTAFLVDNCGNIYVSGWGANILQANPLDGMPVTPDAFQGTSPNGFDFYLIVLYADFSDILYGSYLGGATANEHVDGGTSRFDKNGIVYQSVCAGCGGASDFPTTPGAWSADNNSTNCNNLLFKFDAEIIPVADFTVDQTTGCTDLTVTFDNISSDSDTYLWDFGDGEFDSTTYNPVQTYTEAGSYQVNLFVTDSVCQIVDSAQITILVLDSVIAEVIDPINICNSEPFEMSVNTYGTATNFIWSLNSDFSNPLNIPEDSVITVTAAGVYYIQVGNGFCSTMDTVNVQFDSAPEAEFEPIDPLGCAPLSVSFNNFSVQTSYFLWDFGNGNLDSTSFEPNIEYTMPGEYNVTLYIYDSICPISDSAEVTITVLPNVTIVGLDSVLICDQSSTTLTANSSGTANAFIWSDVPDFSNVLNPAGDSNLVVSLGGTYYVTLSNGFCTLEDSVFVDYRVEPVADFDLDNTLGCAPLNVNFTNNSLLDSDFMWDFGNDILDSLNFNPTLSFDTDGTYEVILYVYDDICDVFDADTAQITVTPEPIIDLVDLIELCVASPTTLAPLIDGANEFVWSSNNNFSDTLNIDLTQALIIIEEPNEGYYFVQANNELCSSIDSVLFVFIEPELALSAEDSICAGDIIDLSVTNMNPLISLDYDWQPIEVLINPSNTTTVQGAPLFSQYIYITATSPEGCIVEDSIFINVSDIDSAFVIASASDYTVAAGSTVTLFGSPSGLTSYQWTPEDGLSAPSNQQTDAVINEDIIYTLSVSDGICSRDDTVSLKVFEIICEDPFVFVPNAFSPNGDGYNDVLYVRGLYIEKVIFRIFDRWGEMVFESQDVSQGWDGVFRDSPLQPDVYDYYLDVTCVGGLKSIVKGNVTLMR